jgi:hypothetical protein
MVGVTRELARYAVESRFEDLPEAVRHEGERAFVNILGCMLGGAKADGIERLLAALKEFSGRPEATLIGRGQRTDILLATLVNAHSQGANAYNDTHLATVAHPTGPVAAPILAMAERQPVTGGGIPSRADPWYRNPAPGRQHPGDAAGALPGRGVDAEHPRGDRRRGRHGQAAASRRAADGVGDRARDGAGGRPPRNACDDVESFRAGQRGACRPGRRPARGSGLHDRRGDDRRSKGLRRHLCQRAQFRGGDARPRDQLRDPRQYLQALPVRHRRPSEYRRVPRSGARTRHRP